jgi:hypothetical protein
MCKGRLAQDPAVRSATDPISGKPVDKAKAVIRRDARREGLLLREREDVHRLPEAQVLVVDPSKDAGYYRFAFSSARVGP